MATRAALKTVGEIANELPTLHNAMASAFAEIEAATKDKTNPHFKSKYADLGSVIDAVKPPLIRYGLFFTQRSHPAEHGVSVETVLHHSGGEQLSLGTLFVPANKNDAQGFGSALTYARRYGLMTAFGVPAEDDDGNAAASSARPSQGASRPMNSDGGDATIPRGEGDMSDSALRGCVKALVHSLHGCGTLADFDDLIEMPETVATIEQCKRRFPNWWSTGAGMPAEFKPLQAIINETRAGLAALEQENA